jgi:hypothetical protein
MRGMRPGRAGTRGVSSGRGGDCCRCMNTGSDVSNCTHARSEGEVCRVEVVWAPAEQESVQGHNKRGEVKPTTLARCWTESVTSSSCGLSARINVRKKGRGENIIVGMREWWKNRVRTSKAGTAMPSAGKAGRRPPKKCVDSLTRLTKLHSVSCRGQTRSSLTLRPPPYGV